MVLVRIVTKAYYYINFKNNNFNFEQAYTIKKKKKIVYIKQNKKELNILYYIMNQY
jgi:hypothetical protein